MSAYRIIRTFGIVVLLVAGFVQCSKIHERITDEEATNLSRTARDKNVAPVGDYRYKRSDENLRRKFTDYGKTIDAYLKSLDGHLIGADTPVWIAFTTADGTVKYVKLPEGIVGRAVSTFLTRPRNSSMAQGKNPLFDGTYAGQHFDSWLKIDRQPSKIRRNSEVPDATIRSTAVTEEEKIRRLKEQLREEFDASGVLGSNKDIIYPSLLVQTYYKGAKTSPNEVNFTDEIIYQLAFWNAVDLRFRQVSNPEIRLHISGIIIGLDQNAIPYLRSDVVNAAKIWDETKKYWSTMSQREDFPGKAYDIVVTITDSDTYHSAPVSQYPGLRPGAIAARTTCNHSSESRFHSIAIVRDNGAFEGILTATYALGSFLGAEHNTVTGDECDTYEGFIMEPVEMIGPKNREFSPCSLRRLSNWLRKPHINCFDTPAEFYPSGNPVPKLLPGDVQGPDKQCQARGYDLACESLDTCTQMQCHYTNEGSVAHGLLWCHNTVAAIEGTQCAPGHKCIEGVCRCMTTDCVYIK